MLILHMLDHGFTVAGAPESVTVGEGHITRRQKLRFSHRREWVVAFISLLTERKYYAKEPNCI